MLKYINSISNKLILEIAINVCGLTQLSFRKLLTLSVELYPFSDYNFYKEFWLHSHINNNTFALTRLIYDLRAHNGKKVNNNMLMNRRMHEKERFSVQSNWSQISIEIFYKSLRWSFTDFTTLFRIHCRFLCICIVEIFFFKRLVFRKKPKPNFK